MPKILTTEADPGFLPAREPGLRGAEWTDGAVTPEGTEVGDLITWDGTDWVPLPAGAEGTSLVSNGTGVAPTFQYGPPEFEAVAATDLVAGQPSYVVGYVVASETLVVAGATSYSSSGTPSTGQWMRRLYVPAEAVAAGATATFYATRIVEMDTTGTAIGDPAYLGDFDPATGPGPASGNNIVFSAQGGPAGASFTARVVGEVITVGATGAVKFFGDYGSRSYTQGGQGEAEVVPFVVNLSITSGLNPTHTLQKRSRLIDAWIRMSGSGTENWIVEITSPAPATLFSQTITTPAPDDIIRLAALDADPTMDIGTVIQASLDGAGLAGTCYLMFMPYN